MYAGVPYFIVMQLRQLAIDARRRDRTWRYLAWSVAAGVMTASLVTVATAFVVLLWMVGLWWLALPMLAVLVAPVLANTALRTVFVPAGYHRLAYYAALYSRPGADPIAYATCAAAWACRSGEAIAWVEARRDTRKPLGDGEVAATGLLAAARGDGQTARVLLRSVAMLVEIHPAVRELVGEWLACDAAERAAWDEIAADAYAARWPATPLTYLLEGVATRRIAAAGAPGALDLWTRWLIAPRRRATYPLVAAALHPIDAPADAPAPLEATVVGTEPLARAIAAHLAFEAEPPTAASLAITVQAWDTALADAATQTWLARRALELDAPAGAIDRAIAEVAVAVTEELAHRAEAAQLGAPPGVDGPVGKGLTRRLRHGRLDALEAGFSRWAERRSAGAALPSIDEWREFIALWLAYDTAARAGGLELRRLAFPHAFSKGSNMAAWLWNKREEYALSHAISRWLLDEAKLVGDTEAIELGHKNCSLAVPTRLGRIQP